MTLRRQREPHIVPVSRQVIHREVDLPCQHEDGNSRRSERVAEIDPDGLNSRRVLHTQAYNPQYLRGRVVDDEGASRLQAGEIKNPTDKAETFIATLEEFRLSPLLITDEECEDAIAALEDVGSGRSSSVRRESSMRRALVAHAPFAAAEQMENGPTSLELPENRTIVFDKPHEDSPVAP